MKKLTDEDITNLKKTMQKYWADHPEEAAKQIQKELQMELL